MENTCGATQCKVWGKTQQLSPSTFFLRIEKGGYCSKHKHEARWNRFFVVSGELVVIIWEKDEEHTYKLKEGDFLDVPPGKFHQFKAKESVSCIEIYWVEEMDPNDIQRESIGGKDLKETTFKEYVGG